ncbi:uncharacterized protein METZ01_LOCUS149163, partial [marine metagenome]
MTTHVEYIKRMLLSENGNGDSMDRIKVIAFID